MCPFCVNCHVNVYLDTLVSFVRTNTRKYSFSLRLPFGCMATKNKLGYCNNDNRKLLINKGMVIENVWSSNLWQPKIFNHHWNFSVSILLTTKVFLLPFFWWSNCFTNFVLGNKNWSMYSKIIFSLEVCWALCYLTSNDCHIPWEGGVKSLWVFEVLDCHIAFVISVEFHYVALKVEFNLIIIY
jgi:hypothetical protein